MIFDPSVSQTSQTSGLAKVQQGAQGSDGANVREIAIILASSKKNTCSGWWLTQPLCKMMEFVGWDDDYSQYIEKKNMFQTTNQHLNHVWQAMKQGFMVPYY